jgi:hypothetical protein
MNADTRYKMRVSHDYIAYGKGKYMGRYEAEMIKELRELWSKGYDPHDEREVHKVLIHFFENQAVRGCAEQLLCAALWEPERLLAISKALCEQKAAGESSHMSRGAAPKLLMLYSAFRDSRPTLSDLRKAWPQYYSKPKKLKWPGDRYTRKLFEKFEIPLRQGEVGRPRNRATKS